MEAVGQDEMEAVGQDESEQLHLEGKNNIEQQIKGLVNLLQNISSKVSSIGADNSATKKYIEDAVKSAVSENLDNFADKIEENVQKVAKDEITKNVGDAVKSAVSENLDNCAGTIKEGVQKVVKDEIQKNVKDVISSMVAEKLENFAGTIKEGVQKVVKDEVTKNVKDVISSTVVEKLENFADKIKEDVQEVKDRLGSSQNVLYIWTSIFAILIIISGVFTGIGYLTGFYNEALLKAALSFVIISIIIIIAFNFIVSFFKFDSNKTFIAIYCFTTIVTSIIAFGLSGAVLTG